MALRSAFSSFSPQTLSSNPTSSFVPFERLIKITIIKQTPAHSTSSCRNCDFLSPQARSAKPLGKDDALHLSQVVETMTFPRRTGCIDLQ